jgi:hypothetical protein
VLFTSAQTSWWSDVSSGVISAVVGGLIVLVVQLIASAPGQSALVSVQPITIQVIQQSAPKGLAKAPVKETPVGLPIAAALASVGLFFAFVSVAVGLTAGLVTAAVVTLAWCVIVTRRRGLWNTPASVALARVVVPLVAVIYAWVTLFLFQWQGATWSTFVTAASGEGEGLEFAVSAVVAFFSTLPEGGLLFAVSLVASVALASVSLALALVTLFRWAAFLSYSYGPPVRFVQVRAKAATAFLSSRWKDVAPESIAALFVVVLSPPVWLTLFGSGTSAVLPFN